MIPPWLPARRRRREQEAAYLEAVEHPHVREPEHRECPCGHVYAEHNDGGGPCTVIAFVSWGDEVCGCQNFAEARQ